MSERDVMSRWRGPERPEQGRLLGGVCAGLAERYEIDPSLLRLAFLLLIFAKGFGVLLYAGLWLVMPAEGSRATSLAATARENALAIRRDLAGAGDGVRAAWARAGEAEWPRPLGRRWLAILLIASGAGIFLWSFGAFAWLTGPRILGLVAVAIGAAALFSLTQERERPRW
jgi:phage shock protein C